MLNIRVLWKEENFSLPNSYVTSLGQLNSLKQRSKKNSELEQKCQESIENDIEKGYVREVSKEELREA